MHEIAKRCGVSRATVSAVLNGKPGVSEKTRDKILNTMRRCQLHHRLLSPSLRVHFAQMFAVVIPDISNPFYSEMQAGFLSIMQDYGNHTLTYPTDGSHEDEVGVVTALLEYDLAGFVVAPTQKSQSIEHLQRITDNGIPLLLLGSTPGLQAHVVDLDNRAGSKLAADHLFEEGHRRIACLAGLVTSSSSKERVMGFVESMLDHDQPFDDSMVVWTDATSTGGYTKALEVLSQKDSRPTALVCFNDVVAIGAYRAAYELGLRIPDDVSIVGFDDIEICKVMGPPLTTVSVQPRAVGQAMANTLLSILKGEIRGAFTRQVVETTLVRRGSVCKI
jgi:LacI family transcriptional regulator